MTETRTIENVYPLTPLQEGMLFHSLYAPDSGLYVEQLSCELAGDLDVAAFTRAWERVVERHAVLRTAYVWKRQQRPLQVVQRRVALPFVRQDWRGLGERERRARLAEFLAADLRAGFELTRAPLTRLALLRLGDDVHQLVWTSHHSILDGWSVPLLLTEVFRWYEAYRTGDEIALPAVRPFGEYVAWLGRQDLAEAEAFWRQRLAGFREPTTLAPLAPLATLATMATAAGDGGCEGDTAREAAEILVELPAAATGRLETAARRHRLTLNTLVQGAWAALLSRHGGGEDVLFGVTVSGRPAALSGVESMVGLFINTLPLRLPVPPAAPVSAWLADLQQRQLELQHHEHSPLSQVQTWSEVPRGVPLFETLLVFENYPASPLDERRAPASPLDERREAASGNGDGAGKAHGHGKANGKGAGYQSAGLRLGARRFVDRANYPLTLVAAPGEELALRLVCERSRFGGAEVARILEHLRNLLEGLGASLEQGGAGRVDELPMLSAAERHQIVHEWDAAPELAAAPRLDELFACQVARDRQALALVEGEVRLSYGELDRRSAVLAGRLRRLGVGPEVGVALLFERSLAMVVATVAVARAGGFYVPLDPGSPRERLAFILADAGVKLAVATPGLAELLPTEIAVVVAGVEEQEDGEALLLPAGEPAGAGALAYVMYTSGSTGWPKGVAVSHRAVARLVADGEYAPLGPGERVAHASNPAFDAATFEIWGALATGACAVVLPRQLLLSPTELGRMLRQEGIGTLFLTTALVQQIAREEPAALASLRQLLFGGEAVEPRWIRRLLSAGGPGRLLHVYGPTETVTFASFQRVAEVAQGATTIPIGRSLGGKVLRVVDAGLSVQPIGVPGELVIGGDGLARGYLGRPELTAERFVPDPLGARGDRLYRTGDLVRRRTGGEIEFLGRLDRQVKIRGFRIEPGEIETALASHPEVREAAVEVWQEGTEKRLAAYVSVVAGLGLGEEELRQFAMSRLPVYMVPAAFSILPSLPLNAHGKLDRSALASLPAPRWSGGEAQGESIAPRNTVEELLAQVWAEVLGVERVGVDEDYFSLGGDSILSIQIVARAARAGCRITPKQLFENPTVAALAAVAGTAPEVDAPQGPVAGPVPLSPIARWFFARGLPEPNHFNQSVLLAVREPVTAEVAAKALVALIVHHDALRLRFKLEESTWRQWNAGPEEESSLVRVDLSALPGPVVAGALESAGGQAQASLDLKVGPLLRAVWFDLPEEPAVRLLLAIHHLGVDGVSWRILLGDLESACRQVAAGEAIALPAKTTSFRRWAERLVDLAGSPAAQAELPYWQTVAGGARTPLVVDRPDGVNDLGSARTVSVELAEEETRALLTQVPAVYRTRIDDVLLAALAQALCPPGGALLVDLEGHGREEERFTGVDLSRTVGWFTSLYTVRLEVGEWADPGVALRAIKEQLRAIPGRGLGWGLLRWLGPAERAKKLAALPRPEVSFNYLGRLDAALPAGSVFAPASESAGPSESRRGERDHALVVNALIAGGRLRVHWSYSAGRHEAATVQGLADAFAERLREAISWCAAALARGEGGYTPSDFPLAGLDPAGLDRALGTRRGIEDLYPLSPLQEGILFHGLYAPGTGLYVEQLACTLAGDLDAEVFAAAWRRTAERHPVLRTSFVWEGLERPLQAVQEQVEIAIEQEDWSGLDESEQEVRLEARMAAERARGFDLGRAPLARWLLARTALAEHRFLWTYHHVLLDGWSYSALIADFLATYEALRRGEEPKLTARSPYRDYIAWLVAQEPARSEEYWRRELGGLTEPTPLGLRASGERGGARAEARDRWLGPESTALLQEGARRGQLTLNTLVAGAWGLLLARMSGRDEVVFGVTVSGRPAELPGVESMVGLFMNTLPLRLELAGTSAVGTWLERLQARQLELRQHEHSSLAKVQGLSGVPRGSALFDSIFVFESYPRAAAVQQGSGTLEVSSVRVEEQTNFPVAVVAVPGERLMLRVDPERGRYDVATIERLLDQLRVVAEAMGSALASGLPVRLEEVPSLSEAERQQVTVEWSWGEEIGLAVEPAHRLVARQAERNPGALAVSGPGEEITYGELVGRSRALARRLRRHGVGPESVVAVLAGRSLALVVGALSVLEAGAAYLPLDPSYPQERLAYLLADSGASVVLVGPGLAELLPAGAAVPVLEIGNGSGQRLEKEAQVEGLGGVGFSGITVDPSQTAYVIYTSGSTGRPKGVAVSQANLSHLICWHRSACQVTEHDRASLIAGPGFDASVLEMWPHLVAGASLHVPSEKVRGSLPDLLAWLVRERITIAFLPTPLAEVALGADWPAETTLRVLLTGGDALHRGPSPGAPFRLVNHYGPTESTVVTTREEVSAESREWGGGAPSIGRPVAGLTARLVDRGGAAVGIGLAGELWAGGGGVARGYLAKPEMTAERFVPDPFAGEPGARAYRTGDLSRYLEDGRIEFLGRMDAQVKVRGFRIEPGEVEGALLAHPAVRQAVVVAVAGESGSLRLAAFAVVGGEKTAPGEGALRDWLVERLPAHMVPAAVEVLDGLPVTANGKVDRRALVERASAVRQEREWEAPRAGVEALLAGIWSEVLRVGRVGRQDNFFALGGDSILSIQVVSRAVAAGCRVTPKQLFENPRVAGLAAVAGLGESEAGEAGGAFVGPVQMTPIARWFFESAPAEPWHFNQSVLLVVGGEATPWAVERAVAALVAEHDALRLRFAREGSGWQGRIAAASADDARVWLRVDLSGLGERARWELARAGGEAQASLDLAAGPVMRAVWLDLPADERRLLLIIHHLAVDGVSWRVLLGDLEVACRQAGRGRVPTLPARTTSFGRWAEGLAAQARSMAIEPEMSWWLRQGRESGAHLALDHAGGVATAATGRSVSVEMTAEVSAALLHDLPRAYRAQVQAALLAALAGALAGGAMVIEVEGHGREEEVIPGVDLSRTVGWFTSLFPLRVEAAETPGEAIVRAKEALRSVPGRGLGWGLLRYLRPEPATAQLAVLPRSQVLFNYLGRLDGALPEGSLFAPAEEPAGSVIGARNLLSHLLVVNALVLGERLRIDLGYSSALHERSTVERWAERLRERLTAIAAHCRDEAAAGRVHPTPSDFPLAGLSAAALAELAAERGEIADLYPASPLQEGLLFHSVLAPGSGVYVEQLVCTLRGALDAAALEGAARRLVARHPILRMSFLLSGSERPLQVVHARVAVAFERLDWSGASGAEQEWLLEELLAADRARGFDLSLAPLMRWTLIRLAEGEHRLLWTHHHALLDGWSFALLTGELLSGHEALRADGSGRELEPPSRPPYRDYIAWLERQDAAAAESYWRRALAGLAEPTPVPGEKPPVPGGAPWHVLDAQLPATETAALAARARHYGLTVNTLVQGAWSALLARWSGRHEVAFGATVSGRPADLPGVEAMVGLFINTLPVRVPTPPAELLIPWLEALQRGQVELRQHEGTPLVAVQEWSGLPRGRALFETVLAFENYPREAAMQGAGGSTLAVSDVRVGGRTHYPLTALVIPGEHLHVRLSCDGARLDGATAWRLSHHLRALLADLSGLLEEKRLQDLSLLSAAESHQLLVEWNDTAPLTRPPLQLLHEGFERHAEQAPEAEALLWHPAGGGTERLTYGELDRASRGVALALLRAGVQPGEPIGICAPRSPAMVTLVLGALRSGAAYVGLDPESPPARLGQVLADAGARLALATEETAPKLADLPVRTLTGAAFQQTGNLESLRPPIDPASPAYVVYTSGSTGGPKGILAHHQGAAAYLTWAIEHYTLTAEDTCLQLAPLTFDASVRDILAPLSVGARLLLVPRETVLDPETLLARIAEHKVTCLPSAVPSLLRRLIETATQPAAPVRLILAAGERLYTSDAQGVAAAFGPQARLYNQYGASECTMSSTRLHALTTIDSAANDALPVGRPIATMRSFIADRTLTFLPPGASGEVLLGGPNLTYGYVGQPERTAEVFVPDPLAPSPGARLYRTGDLGRYLPDGELEYLGRLDHQVKVRGLRVEPGEVEAALRDLASVQDVAVVARELPGAPAGRDAQLAAYVVRREGVSATAADLRAALQERLPDYLVPTLWGFLPVLPLTPHGKVDRAALAVLDPEESAGSTSSWGPAREASPIEALVAGVWSEILGRDRVGLDDSFFELGGHSLLATRVTSRLRQLFAVELPVKALFDAPTVAGLAAEVSRLRTSASDEPPAPPLLPLPRERRQDLPSELRRDLPLSFAQERLWFLDQLVPGGSSYNLPQILALRGRLNRAALAATLSSIVARHEVLRTTFALAGDRPVQVIAPELHVELPLVDLASLPAGRRDDEARALAAGAAARPFDLIAGPLVRALLLRLVSAQDAAPEPPGAELELHVALLTLHHVAADGWSLGVLVREVGELYAARVEGRPARLPALPVQYADYAVWQRNWLAGETLERQLAWWRQRLAGAPPVLDLPLDRPRPAVQTTRGASLATPLPARLSRHLAALGLAHGATAFMALLAGFQILLARITGQDDLVVGTPVANRNRLETEGLIGFFVNTLALRAELADDPGFGTVVERVREETLGAYAHQDLPFEKLVEELHVERSLSTTPLFQALFVLQNAPLGTLELPGLTLVPAPEGMLAQTGGGAAKFDLTLVFLETEDGLVGSWEYNRDLFDPATIVRLAGHFERLLAAAVERPATRVADLTLLSAAERHQLAVETGPAPAALAKSGLLAHGELAAWFAATPDAAAVVAADGATVSYGELARRAERLARCLLASGRLAGPEPAVGVCLDRSPEWIAALLAVLLAGAAYVPLDPAYPDERLAVMLADSGTRLVIAAGRHAARAPFAAVRCLEPHGAEGIDPTDPNLPLPAIAPQATAYVIYTSGSTGRPRGVAVPHGDAARHFAVLHRALGLTPRDRVLQFASASFDVALDQILPTLGAGATLVLRDRELPAPEDLSRRLAETAVTMVDLPVTYLLAWVRAEAERAMSTSRVTGLRLVMTSGEKLPPEVVRLWPRTATAALPLLNGYGPTEAVVTATLFTVTADNAPAVAAAGNVPIGRPFPGRVARVIGRRGELLPLGAAGELVLGGPLGRGYIGWPELTADRFVPGEVGGVPGARLYRTGDLARLLANGEIQFLGRADNQVKVRGHRVELGEIEAALESHPGVRQAAVLPFAGQGGAQLATFVLAAAGGSMEGAAPSAAELRAHLRRSLPEVMVPAAFAVLADFPLTPNGKVDTRALARLAPAVLAESAAAATGQPAAPRSPVEELVAGIYAEVLGRERVGVEDDFFELGGHSLLATQVVSRLRGTCGVELPLATLFESPRVSRLAAAIAAMLAQGTSGAGEVPPLVAVPRGDGIAEIPLSFAQERLWFLDRLAPGSAAYNLPLALELAGELSRPALAASLGAVVARHEALRTTFAAPAGRPVQVIAPPSPVPPPLPLIDLTGLPDARREAVALALATAESDRPFDLQRGPLLRTALLALGRTRHLVLLTLHHAVADGWSLGLLVREVGELYAAFAERREPALPALAVQYSDFAIWQRSWLAGEPLAARLAWWRERLEGAPSVLALPLDRPRPAERRLRGASWPSRLGAAPASRLTALGRSLGATPFMILLAALQALLARVSGEDDLVVGTPVANRDRLETEGLIGFFVNTLALRSDLGGDPSFAAAVARVRGGLLAAYARQDLPFERLVEELRPGRSRGHSPLFQVFFALQNTPEVALELPGFALRPLAVPRQAGAKFDLSLNLQEVGAVSGSWLGAWEYDPDLFDAATVARLAAGFERLLAGALEHPDSPLSGLPLLSPAELHQATWEWNGAPAVDGNGATVPTLLAERARRQPDAIALRWREEGLTHGELDRRAGGLARRLRQAGVRPGALVGICLERSPEIAVALLAVWQAGGAYLPLAPDYPADRLAFLVGDAQPAVVLATAKSGVRLPAGVPLVRPDEEEEIAGAGLSAPSAGLKDPADPIAGPGDLVVNTARSADLAYVIYTSGSTGRPKGVLVEHGSLAQTLVAGAAELGWSAGDSLATAAPFSFDIFLFELLGPLLAGGSCRLLPLAPGLDVPDLVARLPELSRFHAVPAIMRQVVEAAAAGASALVSIRALFVGGDTVPAELLARLREVFPQARQRVLYGPTEAAILATSWAVPPEERPARTLIGRPLPGVEIELRDAASRPLPIGCTGEVWIGGGGVARGYLGRPELTAERFVVAGGRRFYRSGDLARRLANGDLEFIGRADRQVKVRGFRIEPGEVEAALARLPGVVAAAVVPRDDLPGGRGLAGFVAAAAGTTVESLREGLRALLPEYLVPARFALVKGLPITAHGKIDRAALGRVPLDGPEEGGGAGAAALLRDPAEEIVAAIFADLLGRERVSRGDDFFALGGHSLLATQLASRLRAAFGVEVPLPFLFAEPRVAALAARVLRLASGGRAHEPALVPVPRGGDLPLSFAQERLWFLDRLQPGRPAYNLRFGLRLQGTLDRAALAAALGGVAARHESLRTTFALAGGAPVQVIAPSLAVDPPLVDLAALPPAAAERAAAALTAGFGVRPFDLGRGPLVRAGLLRLAADRHLVLLTVHHIVSDGWSTGVLVRELGELYAAARERRPAALAPLPIQYADFAVWQRAWLAGGALAAQLAWWRERLHGAPAALDLPLDRPRPAVESGRGAVVPVALPAALSRRLAAFARGTGTTPFMVLLAGLQALLSRLSGQLDLVVGSPVANRNRLETEGLIGFFVNTLALRADLAGDPDLATLAARVRAMTLGAYAHQDLPFARLVEALRPERSLAHAPLFQVLFAFQNVPLESLDAPGLRMEPLDAAGRDEVAPMALAAGAKFDLTLTLTEIDFGFGLGLGGTLEYATDLFDGATARRLVAHLRTLLEAWAERPAEHLSRLPLLDPAERHQLQTEWSGAGWSPAAGGADPCLHQLFAAQAARTPAAVALVSHTRADRAGRAAAGRELTYAELARRAAALARRLRALGVGPEVVVGICAERSAALVVGLLAILEAGGAYLPLDPASPRERLAEMVADAGAAVLVVSRGMAERGGEDLAGLAGGRPVLWLEDEGHAGESGEGSGEPVVPAGGGDNLAYLIYTSGSTGRPKGVAIVHRAAVARVLWARDAFSAAELAGVLASTSIGFDLSVFELFAPLAWGGRVVLVDNALALSSLPAAADVRLLNTVPSLLAELLRTGPLPGSVRTVALAGEALPRALADDVHALGTVARLLNLYGPSEDTTYSTAARIDPDRAAPPIGRPLPGGTAYLLDADLEPAPIGVPGELFLGGRGLARGYLGRPELTAERFVPAPGCGTAGEPGGRLYRTGDLARTRTDGVLEYLGRTDQQVKVRGLRIEPGEIEAALAALPAVAAAAVVLEEKGGDPRLVAWIVPAPGAALDPEALREALGRTLPRPMVPSVFTPVAALPLTPNGKVDRRALARLEPDAPRTEAAYVAPRYPLEELVAEMWIELLGVERVGAGDNFFALGGHSLQGIRLVSEVSDTLGVDVGVRVLFEAPTLGAFSLRVAEEMARLAEADVEE